MEKRTAHNKGGDFARMSGSDESLEKPSFFAS